MSLEKDFLWNIAHPDSHGQGLRPVPADAVPPGWQDVAIEEGNVGLWWWDREASQFFVAGAFQTMLGLDPQPSPLSLHDWLDRVHPDDRAAVLVAAEKHFDGLTPRFRVEYRVRRADGSYLWLLSSGRTIQQEGTGRRIVGTFIDITPQKLAEQSLAEAQAAAERTIEAKNQFLSKMSHELRTPLTSICGYAELLLDHVRSEETLEPVMSIRRNGHQLLRVLNDIMNLAHLDQGKVEILCREVPVRQLLRDAVDTVGGRAAAKGIPIQLEIGPEVPKAAKIDPVRVRQVLTQLLSNAVKFTETGEVTLAVHSHWGGEPLLRFEVRDTGIGIAQQRLEAIFEPFAHASESPHCQYTGSGLGLSLCRRLSQVLGGRLSVESTVGEGSTFQLVIPFQPIASVAGPRCCDPAEAMGEGSPAAQGPLNCRILLVEDGLDNQRLVSLILRKAGAQVDIAENGRRGVEMALATFPGYGHRYNDPKQPYDLIIMDMQMPIMDGYEATRTLRSSGYRKPVIALTAHALTGDREKCLAAGCDEYATKPIQRQHLIELLTLYLEKSRQTENTPGIPCDEPSHQPQTCDQSLTRR